MQVGITNCSEKGGINNASSCVGAGGENKLMFMGLASGEVATLSCLRVR